MTPRVYVKTILPNLSSVYRMWPMIVAIQTFTMTHVGVSAVHVLLWAIMNFCLQKLVPTAAARSAAAVGTNFCKVMSDWFRTVSKATPLLI